MKILDPVYCAAARRQNVVVFTFLVGDKVLFISAEPDVNIDRTAQKNNEIIFDLVSPSKNWNAFA